MPRFFIRPEAVEGDRIYITGGDAFHIARSLRMAVGDSVTVCDGAGSEYACTLERIRDDECVALIAERREASEPKRRVTLYMAYPKGDKMETVVQKSVELGASVIVPFESDRCIKRPSPEKAGKLAERLSRIAEEAAKQCGRGTLPEVSRPVSFRDMLRMAEGHSLTLFCYEAEKAVSIRRALEERGESIGDIGVIVGSEGGFSPAEAEAIVSVGAVSVTLGPRILRCETAPLLALSAICYFFEL